MGAFESLVYLTLAVTEFTALFKLALGSPALKGAAHLLTTDACYAEPGMRSYPFLGAFLNQRLCMLNLIFDRGANGPKSPAVLLTNFGPLFMTACAIATYESFRQIHRRNRGLSGLVARATSIFVLIGQRFTAGFAMPLQRAFTSWSTAAGNANRKDAGDIEALTDNLPQAKYIWATLLSLLLGLALPSWYMQESKFEYFALSIWQPFPLYTLALNVILPPLFAWTRSRYVPTVLLTLLLIGASLRTHAELVKGIAAGEINLREVLLLDLPADTLSVSHGAHLVFAIDMASIFLLNVFTVLFGYGAGLGGFLVQAIPAAVATAVLGPGGAFALFWGVKELRRQRALAKATPVLGKLKTN